MTAPRPEDEIRNQQIDNIRMNQQPRPLTERQRAALQAGLPKDAYGPTPPRPNEGIDVEKEAKIIAFKWLHVSNEGASCSKEIIALCTKVRAETEAAVTKRERERLGPFIEASILHRETWKGVVDEQRHFKNCRICLALAAYESNDAGEKP